MELVGKIIQVLPAQEGVGRNGNPWKVQPYVLETLDQYPRKVHFEVFGEDRIKQNPCEIDQLVTISFDICSCCSGGSTRSCGSTGCSTGCSPSRGCQCRSF